MNRKCIMLILAVMPFLAFATFAQNMQIAPSQIPQKTKVVGNGTVAIQVGEVHGGKLTFNFKASYDPQNDDYPTGAITLTMRFPDNSLGPKIEVKVLEQEILQLTSTHNKYLNSAFLYARCSLLNEKNERIAGYLWMMASDNRSTNEKDSPDIIQVVLMEKNGIRTFSVCGPVDKGGEIRITP